MKGTRFYEEYPIWIVALSNSASVAIYLIGAFIIYQFGLVWMALYLFYIGLLEIRVLKWHCVDCYYYGKACAFGKGKLSALLFNKGDPSKFCRMKITMKDIIPDFAVFIIPTAVGAMILLANFSWLILALTASLFLLGFAGNALVRGRLACRFCKQRELGCPAEQLFDKKK